MQNISPQFAHFFTSQKYLLCAHIVLFRCLSITFHTSVIYFLLFVFLFVPFSEDRPNRSQARPCPEIQPLPLKYISVCYTRTDVFPFDFKWFWQISRFAHLHQKLTGQICSGLDVTFLCTVKKTEAFWYQSDANSVNSLRIFWTYLFICRNYQDFQMLYGQSVFVYI